MTGTNRFGLSGASKADLLARLGNRSANHPATSQTKKALAQSETTSWADLPGYKDIQTIRKAADALGIADPFFRSHDGRAGAESVIGGCSYINFSSYDYLGLNGHPSIVAATARAIETYGTSVSASRMVSGERPIHRHLEENLATFYGVEDAVCMVSGHATNVSVIGHIMTAGDLILHDELIHNSVIEGSLLSGAKRFAFSHNDPEIARRLLESHRKSHKRALLVIEGQYSMDGDLADLPAFVNLAREFDCWLMVDEAHALGVLGRTGRGIAEHFNIDPGEVDIWMGTLSKTLVSCGGYIAGKHDLIDYLKCSAPGFVYSVGMSPPNAAAAHAALEVLRAEPMRVAQLGRNANSFLSKLKSLGIDTGPATGASIIPLIVGSSIKAARLSEAMFARGINVQPILYPAVPERAARLRFFLSAAHSEEQIDETVIIIRDLI